MIRSILLVDDEDLFHLVFEDACSLLDITFNLETLYSSDEAANLFNEIQNSPTEKPDVVFADLNIIGSTINGIELVDKINHDYGNGVVIGIISSSCDDEEIERAIHVGAQFWIVKSDDIEPRLEEFKKDFQGYKDGTLPFKVYQ